MIFRIDFTLEQKRLPFQTASNTYYTIFYTIPYKVGSPGFQSHGVNSPV